MNEIQWKLNYRETVPRDEWDAMMELKLDDPTGLQTMQDEGWLFLAEHSLADTIPQRVERGADRVAEGEVDLAAEVDR